MRTQGFAPNRSQVRSITEVKFRLSILEFYVGSFRGDIHAKTAIDCMILRDVDLISPKKFDGNRAFLSIRRMKDSNVIFDSSLARGLSDIRHRTGGRLVFITEIHLNPQLIMIQRPDLDL